MADEYPPLPWAVNPLYAGILQAYGIDDDTKPVLDEEILAQWVKYSDALAKYRAKRDAGQLKRETDDIKARLGYIKSSRDLQAKLEETKGKDRRETVKAYVDRVNTLTKARTDLAVQRSQFSDTVFSEARSAFDKAVGKAGPADSAEALFKTLNDRQMKWSEGNPDTAGLATQWARMVLGEPNLQNVNPEAAAQAIRDAGGNNTLARNTAQFIRVSQQADSMERSATAKLASEEERAARLSAMGDLELAGLSEESIEDIVQGSANAQLAFETLLAETPEQMQERMNAIAEADSQYAAMVAREKQLAAYVFGEGNEGAFTRTGRIIANPEFQAWAQDNGYNIGRAQVNAEGGLDFYTPGNADMRAIAAFNRQVKTGQPPRMFGARNSGQLIRVTVTDPAARERVLQFNNLGGGRYAVQDGAVLTPQQYAEMGIAPSGVEFAQVGNDIYIKSAGQTYKYENKVLTPVAAPAGAKFVAGVVYDDNDKPMRYMTANDISAVPENFGGVSEGEDAAINQAAGVDIVGADQLPAVGEMQVVGYRDRLNARDMTQYGEGAFSINGGQYVFGKGAKAEVLETRGREPAANALARRAGKRVERAGLTGLPVEAVRRAEPGQTYAQPGGVFPPAPAAGAAAPLTADADFLKPAAAGIEVEGGALGPAAPTVTAKAPTVDYIRGADGAVYRSTEGVGIQQIAPRRGETRIDPRVIAEETPEFSALTGRLFADGEPLSEEEGRRVEMRDVGAQARVAAPETQVREIRGSTFMGPGRVRNLGTDIRDIFDRMRQRRGAKAEDAPAPPPKDEALTPQQRRDEKQRTLPPDITTAAEGVPPDVSKRRGPADDRVGKFYEGFGPLRNEAALQSIKNVEPGQPMYDLSQRYAKAHALKDTDPAAYYKEIAGLAKELNRRPAGTVFTPGEAESPTAGYERQRAERRAETVRGVATSRIGSESAQFNPVTGESKLLEGVTTPRRAPKEPAARPVDDFDLKPPTPTVESQPSASLTKSKGLSAFRRVMPKRKLPATTEETEIV